jgi:alkylation response protein AidB-like acyl-CoA dehydrogenase
VGLVDLEDLRQAASTVLAKEFDREAMRRALEDAGGPGAELWERLVDLGWTSIGVPEEHGGAGAGFRELGVILQELGRATAPALFMGSAVLATTALRNSRPSASTDDLLARLADGRSSLTIALSGLPGRIALEELPLEARPTASGWRLDGEAAYAPDAQAADRLVVAARLPCCETVVGMVESVANGVAIAPSPVLDLTRRFSTVHLHDTPLRPESVLATGEEAAAPTSRPGRSPATA